MNALQSLILNTPLPTKNPTALLVMTTRTMSTTIRKVLQSGQVFDNIDEMVLSIDLNKDKAEVQYNILKNGQVYDLVHTRIPDAYQGLGLGHILAERVFDHLIDHKKKIKITCEFLQRFYLKNSSKYEKYVVN